MENKKNVKNNTKNKIKKNSKNDTNSKNNTKKKNININTIKKIMNKRLIILLVILIVIIVAIVCIFAKGKKPEEKVSDLQFDASDGLDDEGNFIVQDEMSTENTSSIETEKVVQEDILGVESGVVNVEENVKEYVLDEEAVKPRKMEN